MQDDRVLKCSKMLRVYSIVRRATLTDIVATVFSHVSSMKAIGTFFQKPWKNIAHVLPVTSHTRDTASHYTWPRKNSTSSVLG